MYTDEDQIAEKLLFLARLAKTMPPSWDLGGMKHPIAGPQGEWVGHVLPGRGVYVDTDLSKVHINRQLPHVFEYSSFNRLRDATEKRESRERDLWMGRYEKRPERYDPAFLQHPERYPYLVEAMAITTYDGIIAARGGGKADDIFINKSSITMAAGFWYDTWLAGGTPPAGTYLATTPPTDVLLDRSSVGAWSQMLTNPGGTDKKYLLSFGMSAASAHSFGLLIDRHSESSSYTLTAATSTITTPKTVVRNYSPIGTLGTGNQIIAPVVVVRGTPGAGTWQITYLDEAAGSSVTPANALPATADPVNRLIAHIGVGSPFLQLAAADIGVRQVSSAVRAAAGDTTGTAGLDIVTPLAFVPTLAAANVYVERDLPSDLSGLLELANVSQVIGCIGLLVFANATTMGTVLASLRTCSG